MDFVLVAHNSSRDTYYKSWKAYIYAVICACVWCASMWILDMCNCRLQNVCHFITSIRMKTFILSHRFLGAFWLLFDWSKSTSSSHSLCACPCVSLSIFAHFCLFRFQVSYVLADSLHFSLPFYVGLCALFPVSSCSLLRPRVYLALSSYRCV